MGHKKEKKKEKKNSRQKGSLKNALLYLTVMVGIFIYSLLSGGADDGFMPWYMLSIVIIAAAFPCALLIHRLPVPVQIILTAAAPACTFVLTENFTHRMNEMWPGPVALNLILYYLLFIWLILLLGSVRLAVRIGLVTIASFGLLDYFLKLFRGQPIFPWDFNSIGVAFSVAGQQHYTISAGALNVILLVIFYYMMMGRVTLRISSRKVRIAGGSIMTAAVIGFCAYLQTEQVTEDFSTDKTLFTPNVFYRNNGLLVSFLMDMRYLNVEKPEGYTADQVQQIEQQLAGENEKTDYQVSEESPNIIVIMNESFSDLSVLGDFETNEDYMPYIHSMQENTQKGWMYSSVKGTNTANTEFEFLTGMSMYFLPIGSVPYQQYIRSEVPALPAQLSSLGYTSVSMHPYYGSGWNRDKIYGFFGFDRSLFLDSFYSAERIRDFVSDRAIYQKVENLYETKDSDERLFVFNVTMQNHGGYTRQYADFQSDITVTDGTGTYLQATEQYLSLIKESDQAFGELIDYFSQQDEPTIILMFGDHQPSDYVVESVDGRTSDDLENQQKQYEVPYILWANYDIDEAEGDVTSANYLGVKLLQTAGIPLTDFQYYLSALQEKVPAVTANMGIGADGTFYARGDAQLDELLHDYSLMEYNDLKDTDNRVDALFSY